MRNLEVCLTPDLLHLFDIKEKCVVVVDVFRATSCMTTAIAHGVKEIVPVACLEDCRKLTQKGYVGAAERDGRKAKGFDIGNSPFSYMDNSLKGKSIAMTTTNGTKAIHKAQDAWQILIGSFLNISELSRFLKETDRDILVLCAGWKGMMNLEDSLFAGALIEKLKDSYAYTNDSSMAAAVLYREARKDMMSFLQHSSHARRLSNLNIEDDVEFCLTPDLYDNIPILHKDVLIRKEPVSEIQEAV